jgi:hypothetical protein
MLQNSKYHPEITKLFIDFLTQRQCPVCVIYGNPETGKSDTGVLIAEIGLHEGIIDHFASNMKTGIGQRITSLEDVKFWHRNESGKKLFILDEAGINDDARNPMSKQNREIRHEIFIARKFFVHWIFILQELKDVDTWKSSSLTGLMIEKDAANKVFYADIKPKLDVVHPIYNFPRTSLYFDTLDVAPFTLKKQVDETQIKLCGKTPRCAMLYSDDSLGQQEVAAILKKEYPEISWTRAQILREVKAYIKQTLKTA